MGKSGIDIMPMSQNRRSRLHTVLLLWICTSRGI